MITSIAKTRGEDSQIITDTQGDLSTLMDPGNCVTLTGLCCAESILPSDRCFMPA